MKPNNNTRRFAIVFGALALSLSAPPLAMAETVRPSAIDTSISDKSAASNASDKNENAKSNSQPNPGNGKADKGLDWGKYNNHGHHPQSSSPS